MSGRTSLYLRGVSRQLVREAKAAAARRGSTLAALISESVARSLREEPGDPLADGLQESRLWYERNRPRLLTRYRGQYVAVVDRSVVDHDRDFSALATRVFTRHPGRPVFIPRVQETEQRARVRSPRRTRP